MKRIGFTSGSFDPVTNGHLDVIRRAARLVDELVIGIGVHPGKAPLFTTDEKIEMLKAEAAGIAKATGCTIEISTFDKLTVDAAKAVGATLIFRGLRVAILARDDFSAMLAAGLTVSLGLQTLIITAGIVKLIPLTGITFPFVSYGGSSLLASFIIIGLLLAISHRSTVATEREGRGP